MVCSFAHISPPIMISIRRTKMNFLSYTPEQMNEIVEFIAQNYDL